MVTINIILVFSIADTVTFDNTYSLMRSKKIHYCVYVTPSIDKMNILPAEENTADETAATQDKHSNSLEDSNKVSENLMPLPVH